MTGASAAVTPVASGNTATLVSVEENTSRDRDRPCRRPVRDGRRNGSVDTGQWDNAPVVTAIADKVG